MSDGRRGKPVLALEDDGLKILLPHGGRRELELLNPKQLAADIVQLHYVLKRR
ncbi:MAG TPA: hypothetical protein VER11_15805 [Polyangiaceae bacterium]|nr:hypothetical protein [Polyangiaceae bacterium]